MNLKQIQQKHKIKDTHVIHKGDTSSPRSRIVKIKKVIVRVERYTTLYGEQIKIYHPMAYNSDGKLIHRKSYEEPKKTNRNWLGCFCFPVLFVYYEKRLFLAPLSETLNTDQKIPFIDETNLVIDDDH